MKKPFLLVALLLFALLPLAKPELQSLVSLSGKDWSFTVASGGLEKSAYAVDVAKGKELRYIFNTLEEAQKYDGVFSFPVSVEGLTCYYQPPLDSELKLSEYSYVNSTHALNGSNVLVHRPTDVVNSYACFDKTSKKVMHIYRSALLDSKGTKIWCDMKLDTELGLLSVLWNVKVLEGLVYPVVVDPTFGYEDVGGTTWGSLDTYCVGGKFTLSEDANSVDVISFYNKGVTANVQVALYDDNGAGGQPYDRLIISSVESCTGSAWHDFTVSYGALSAGNYVIIADFNNNDAALAYDSGGSGYYLISSLDDPINSMNTIDRTLSMHVDYTVEVTYTLSGSITSPTNSTYTVSSVSWTVTKSGNDTLTGTQIALYANNGTQIGTNQTSLTGTWSSLTNASYMMYATLTGGNATSWRGNVNFTVSVGTFELTLEYVYNSALLMGLLALTGGICFILVIRRRNE